MLNDVSTHFSSDNEGLGTIVLYSSAKIGVQLCCATTDESWRKRWIAREREREFSSSYRTLCVQYSTRQTRTVVVQHRSPFAARHRQFRGVQVHHTSTIWRLQPAGLAGSYAHGARKQRRAVRRNMQRRGPGRAGGLEEKAMRRCSQSQNRCAVAYWLRSSPSPRLGCNADEWPAVRRRAGPLPVTYGLRGQRRRLRCTASQSEPWNFELPMSDGCTPSLVRTNFTELWLFPPFKHMKAKT
jgi:hypothetical protein